MAVTWSSFAHCRVFQKSGGVTQGSCHFDISIALVFDLVIMAWKAVPNPHTFGIQAEGQTLSLVILFEFIMTNTQFGE